MFASLISLLHLTLAVGYCNIVQTLYIYIYIIF